MSKDGLSNTRKLTLIVLGLGLAGTVFLLPQLVSEPWVLTEDARELPAVPEPTSAVAPSTAAELKTYRQESQTVLAEVVAMRDRLRTRGVEVWAEADFSRALAQVEAGDQAYSYGEYADSLARYRQARDGLAGLERLGEEKLEQAMADAEAAVESLNLNVATAAIELARHIAAADPAVQALARRVDTLPEVAAHLEAGDEALERDRFAAAQAEYRQAASLDPDHRRAAEALAGANRAVGDSAFRSQMSRGFAAMQAGDYAGARAAFHEAGRMRPGDPAVGNALAQVDNLETGDAVGRSLAQAAALEAEEAWPDAVAIYERLLQQDPSLTDARVKLIPARVRADLDQRMTTYIDEPLKLSSQSDYRAAQAALADARGIPEPGPRLRAQIDRLNTLVQRADSPVDVVFRSDNQTRVVLFRVADLGTFEQKSVRLRPGKYVAAGTRSGYRDVRVEFTVTGEPPASPIVVRCEEPIG